MIRFPERFHASRTPKGARCIEPHYQETEVRESDGQPKGRRPKAPHRPRFSFDRLAAVLG